jgi:hypothetical protein
MMERRLPILNGIRCHEHPERFIMKSLHALPHATRLLFGAFAIVALLAAASAVAAAEPITSDQFAPGWQAHAKPLFYQGMTMSAGRDKYQMPGILPTGDYVLVARKGDKAQLIDGQRITVRAGNDRQIVFVDAHVGDVLAVPVADVPTLDAKRKTAP